MADISVSSGLANASLFERLFESSPDGIVLTDREGRIVRVNGQAESMFGYRREELLGQPVELLGPERFRSSLGVYSGKLSIPLEPFAAGLGDHRIVTTLCPGGKERMRRSMELVKHGRVALTPLITHRFPLDQITEAYEMFGDRRDGVIKVAVKP